MGYHRAGFEVVGVDIKPQPHYPFEFHQADAMTYPLDGFDAIHASPPCQRYSVCTPMSYRKNHPALIDAVRDRLMGYPHHSQYVIENVSGARHLLVDPIMLCGTMFGLNIQRHRYFETWPPLFALLPPCNHKRNPVYISGSTGSGSSPLGFRRFDFTTQERRDAMDCQWMTDKELDQAIPPAYTEWIGKQLMQAIKEIENDQT
jgi:DNA (cytosine-5)-methyltransferase 1